MSDPQLSFEALVCGHCGEKNRMRTIGSVTDAQQHSGIESGTLYELYACPQCEKLVLSSRFWHDMMEGPEESAASVLLPEARDRDARELLLKRDLDIECMLLAVNEARQSAGKDVATKPRVGAVVVREGRIVASAHRGEHAHGEHAEYTLLEGKCKADELAGATVYTTLEPCTTRNHPKVPCVERLIGRKVARVVIGMLDPDDRIRGRGVLALRKANIQVDLFPPDLMAKLEELNREFTKDREQSGSSVVPASASSMSVAADARRLVVSLAKSLRLFVVSLPDGTAASMQQADQTIRAAVMPEGTLLTELLTATATVGTSVAELGVAAVEDVRWMLRICADVQGTPLGRGFDYTRIRWKDWADRWSRAVRALESLAVVE